MLRQIPIALQNGVQTFAVQNGLQGLAQLIVAAATAPSAGTVTIDYMLSGSNQWTRALA
jgi:hypothetical protein